MSLVPLANPSGQKLLAAASPRGGYDSIAPHWCRQVHRTACGLATTAVLLNTLGCATPAAIGAERPQRQEDAGGELADEEEQPQALTEDTVAEMAAAAGVDVDRVRSRGMTLEVFQAVVQGAGGSCDRFHADSIAGEAAMRELLLGLLGTDGAGVAVNYDMTTLGQVPFKGHFSPLVAYNPVEDRWLIMDVWPDTEPVWATTAGLWRSVNTVDPDSGASRGFAAVSLQG